MLKQKYKTTLLLALAIVGLSIQSLAGKIEPVSKTILEKYAVSSDSELRISNKFGDIELTTWDKDSIVIAVSISGEAKNNAQESLDEISVKFITRPAENSEQVSSYVEAITQMGTRNKNVKINQLQINYTVMLPKTSRLVIRNQFGNVSLNESAAAVAVDVRHGNFYAQTLEHPDTRIAVSFGKAEIDLIKRGKVLVSHSNLVIDEGGEVSVSSDFGGSIRLGNFYDLDLRSRNDKVSIQHVTKLKANCHFSSLDIAVLIESLDVDIEHGGLEINSVHKDFKTMNLDARFADVEARFNKEVGFKLNADLEFSSLSYPKNSQVKEEELSFNSSEMNGWVGSADATAIVNINCKHGKLKLTNDKK